MKKFKFSLDKLKSFKEQIKKREENTLASLRAEQLDKLHEKEELLKELENKISAYFIAEESGKISGYAGIWKIVDEGHITNVAVAPAHRRKHIASALLESLFRVTERAGIVRHTLEVRAGNEGAIRLYESFGFKADGIRKGYYEDNGEDALIMWR